MTWQPWDIAWPARVQRELRRLSLQDRERVLDAVDGYADTGRGDVRRLTTASPQWRLRVGELRIVFALETETRRLTILSVDRRDSIYR